MTSSVCPSASIYMQNWKASIQLSNVHFNSSLGVQTCASYKVNLRASKDNGLEKPPQAYLPFTLNSWTLRLIGHIPHQSRGTDRFYRKPTATFIAWVMVAPRFTL